MTGLTGTGPLVRLAWRIDRIRLPIWVAAITLIVVTTAASFVGLYPDEASRREFGTSIGANPALRALYGPMFSPETIGGLTVWRQGAIMLVFVSLMNLLTVTRHTRAAEETGRLELVGAAVVGRRAPLTAALVTAGVADLLVVVAVTLALVGVGEPLDGSVAFALGLGLTGLFFGAVAAITAQLTDSARAASGIAGAVLAAGFALRAVGDAAQTDGLAWLSWLSPLGWAQQARPFADERWWTLGLSVLGIAVAVGVADVLVGRRDFGSGMLPTRAGPAQAAPGFDSPLALAWRLQRATLLWWAIGLAALSSMFGSVVEAITELFADTPRLADILERLGGAGMVVDVFLGAIMGVFAVLVSAFAIGAVLRLRVEETSLRAEHVLAAAVSRTRWAASHLGVAIIGPAVLLAIAGACAGLATGLVTGEGLGRVADVTVAAVAHLPAVWVLVGIALLCLGVLPRWTTMAWGALAVFLLLGQVGEALQWPQAMLDLSPYAHVPPMPGAAFSWVPLLWLTAVAVALGAVGLAGLRRRDIG